VALFEEQWEVSAEEAELIEETEAATEAEDVDKEVSSSAIRELTSEADSVDEDIVPSSPDNERRTRGGLANEEEESEDVNESARETEVESADDIEDDVEEDEEVTSFAS